MKELASAQLPGPSVRPVAKWDNAFSFCSRHPLLGGSDLIGAVCVKYYEPLNVFKFYVSSFHNNSTQYIVRGVTPKPPTKKQTKNGAINIRSAVCKGLNKKDVYLCLYVTQDISLKYLLYYMDILQYLFYISEYWRSISRQDNFCIAYLPRYLFFFSDSQNE